MARIAIDEERCKGCQFCVHACPKKILVVLERYNQKGYAPAGVRDLEKCTGCALCAEMCPDICISVWREEGGGGRPGNQEQGESK